ncbi:MAG: helix-turn-helix domain-containing protein [Ilumatobacteraceae bacterium]
MTITNATQQCRIHHPSAHLPVIRHLVDEWSMMGSRSHNLRQVNGWGLPGTPLISLDDVLVRAGFGTGVADSNGDQYLLLLVKRAAHDELAARIVLQRILPPLLAIARRRGRIIRGGVDEALTETLSHAWELIRTYPAERRPAKVAANLVRDAEYFAFVRNSRKKTVAVVIKPADELERLAEPQQISSPSDELWRLLHEADQKGMTPKRLDVLRRLANGDSFELLAADYGVAIRTVRTWRKEGITELRARTLCVA